MTEKKVGRPKKYTFTEEDKKLMITFVRDYNKNHNPDFLIKYKLIWEHSLNAYAENSFPFKTSYDFWKRKGRIGREIVDSINKVEKEKTNVAKSNHLDILKIKRIIEKFGGKHKDIIWDNLEPYNNLLERLQMKLAKKEKDYEQLEKIILRQTNELNDLSNRNKSLENLALSLFLYGNKDNELHNMLSTGQSKSKIVNLALSQTFANPEEFSSELLKHYNSELNSTDKIITDKNIISFDNAKNNKPEYDL